MTAEATDLLRWLNEQQEPLKLTAEEFERLLAEHYENEVQQEDRLEKKLDALAKRQDVQSEILGGFGRVLQPRAKKPAKRAKRCQGKS